MTTCLRSEYDGDCIIQYTLSKDQHVENRINLQRVEQRKCRHRVYSGDQRPESKALHKR